MYSSQKYIDLSRNPNRNILEIPNLWMILPQMLIWIRNSRASLDEIGSSELFKRAVHRNKTPNEVLIGTLKEHIAIFMSDREKLDKFIAKVCKEKNELEREIFDILEPLMKTKENQILQKSAQLAQFQTQNADLLRKNKELEDQAIISDTKAAEDARYAHGQIQELQNKSCEVQLKAENKIRLLQQKINHLELESGGYKLKNYEIQRAIPRPTKCQDSSMQTNLAI